MSWLLVGIGIFVIWLWWDGLGAKEIARNRSKQLCQQSGVQFLDDTVSMIKIRFCRHTSGRLGLYRRFGFEFSTDGEFRYRGYVDMFGEAVLDTYMEPYRIG